MLYATLYAISKGLNVVTTAMMSKSELQIGGIHWHVMLCISTEEKASTFRRAELCTTKILKNKKKLDFICSLHDIAGDELGQKLVEKITTYNIIFCHIKHRSL